MYGSTKMKFICPAVTKEFQDIYTDIHANRERTDRNTEMNTNIIVIGSNKEIKI